MLASVLANCNRDPRSRSKPFLPQDFYPSPPKRSQSMAEQMALIWGAAGGKGRQAHD